jgi:Protein of unknwon function (DUF3310)
VNSGCWWHDCKSDVCWNLDGGKEIVEKAKAVPTPKYEDQRGVIGGFVTAEEEKQLVRLGYPAHDPVLKPAHYARWRMEPIEFISVNDFPFWLANVIKYACRYDAKDGLQDLYKARAYLDIQIRKVEGHKNADSGRSRPPFRDEAARHSEIIPPTVPR